MKKLIVGRTVEEREATCNWCSESKSVFKAILPNTVGYFEANEKLKWLRPRGFFAFGELYWVRDGDREYKEQERYADICRDCARQLAKI